MKGFIVAQLHVLGERNMLHLVVQLQFTMHAVLVVTSIFN